MMGSRHFQRSKRLTLDTQTFRECSQRMQLQLDDPLESLEEVSLFDRPTPPPRKHRTNKPCKLVTDLDADCLPSSSSARDPQDSPEEVGPKSAESSYSSSSADSTKKASTLKQKIVLKMKSPKKLILTLMTAIADNIQIVQQDNLR